MSLPTGTPTEFTVARVEVKKTLPAKDGNKPATIYKLGLIDTAGEKGWAELFVRDGQSPPGEGTKETLILTQPDNPDWALKAARPRSGGGGARRRDPAETRAIQRQHSQGMAIQTLALVGFSTDDWDDLKAVIEEWADWFDRDIANGKAS